MKGRKVERLPDQIRKTFYQLLESQKFTCQQIADQVNDMLLDYHGDTDVQSIDDNTVWREAKLLEQTTKQLKDAEIWANSMADKFDLSQMGEQGRLLMSMLQAAAFKTTTAFMGKSEPIDPETLGDLVLSISRLQRSANYNAALEKQIREQAVAETKARAAEEAEKAVKKAGADADTIAKLREAITGVRL
ncbi:phage protein Gp27 family protein [Bowmanella denitrificans]|uniref:phage protein Gp27 family protein n=1 Tax=Bowmanella denitrificans TaxID=366582 RepID=UPI001559CB76|nr:phage protein Gp27 family protein [Bowmanella denitrificans]